MTRAQMARAAFTVAVVILCSTAAATPQPLVTVESPCECRDNHGKGRWAVKNDPSAPPTDASGIQPVTPSQMYGWPGIDAQLTWQSERTGIENNWFALTGRVVAVKVEADGDLHLALQDAAGDNPGIVVCEVPAQPSWCSIRQTVFGWTQTRFPLQVRSTRKLIINQAPVVTIVGKAFWDIGHAPKRSIEPEKEAAQLRGLGDSSGDENRIEPIKLVDTLPLNRRRLSLCPYSRA